MSKRKATGTPLLGLHKLPARTFVYCVVRRGSSVGDAASIFLEGMRPDFTFVPPAATAPDVRVCEFVLTRAALLVHCDANTAPSDDAIRQAKTACPAVAEMIAFQLPAAANRTCSTGTTGTTGSTTFNH